jgi:hypothetical protein
VASANGVIGSILSRIGMAFVFFTLLLVTIFLGVILSSFLGVIPDGLDVGAATFLTILDLLIFSIFNTIIISYLSSPLLLWRLPDPLLFGGLLSSVAAAFPFAC